MRKPAEVFSFTIICFPKFNVVEHLLFYCDRDLKRLWIENNLLKGDFHLTIYIFLTLYFSFTLTLSFCLVHLCLYWLLDKQYYWQLRCFEKNATTLLYYLCIIILCDIVLRALTVLKCRQTIGHSTHSPLRFPQKKYIGGWEFTWLNILIFSLIR